MTPSLQNNPRSVIDFISLRPLGIAFLVLALAPACVAQQRAFYAIGAAQFTAPDAQHARECPYKDVRLYEVDAASLKAVRSLDVEEPTPGVGVCGFAWMNSGMLAPGRDAIVMSDGGLGESNVIRVLAPSLAVETRMKVGERPGVNCADHTFVDPLSGLAYFSCDIGSNTSGLFVVNTVKGEVLPVIRTGGGKPVAYDATHRWLYLSTGVSDVKILDQNNRVVGAIRAQELARKAGLPHPETYFQITDVALLPHGVLALVAPGSFSYGVTGPVLFLYNPSDGSISHTWRETRTFQKAESYVLPTGKTATKTVQQPFGLADLVPSQDASRLFAVSMEDHRAARAILFDRATARVLRTWSLPEAPADVNGSCFAPAPDGRGMWFFGKSGKIYRLDDHTGELLGEVKLPFHLISLIREP